MVDELLSNSKLKSPYDGTSSGNWHKEQRYHGTCHEIFLFWLGCSATTLNIQHFPLYNLAYYKELYCVAQHTHCNTRKSSYLLCKYERDAAAGNPKYECICWTKEEYENLRQKSQE